MDLKKETRILVIDRLDRYIVAAVVRGFSGVEGIILVDSCLELHNMLESRKGIAAEVNYILENDVCGDMGFRALKLDSIRDRDIVKALQETIRILSASKAKLTQLKTQLSLRA